MTQFLFLGLVALPFAAILYALTMVLGPKLLVPLHTSEPDSEIPAHRPPGVLPRPRGIRLSRGQVAIGLLIVAVLLLNQTGYLPRRSNGETPNRQPGPGLQAIPSLPAPMPLKALARLGSDGSGPGHLHDPRDVTIDGAGNLYVADAGNHRVVKIAADGAFVQAWNASPAGPLAEPAALAAVKDGVVVLDNETGQLHKYDFNGRPVPSFEHSLALYRPRGLTVDAAGVIYVADTGRNRVVVVDPTGAELARVGDGALEQPTSVAVDDRGDMYVAEPNSKRIARLGHDGKVQAHWPLTASNTILGPHLLWLPKMGLLATLPDQDVVALYADGGAVSQTWTSEGKDREGILQRPLGLVSGRDEQSLWVVSNGTAQLVQLALPG